MKRNYDALDTVVISPTDVISYRMPITLICITLYMAICITIVFINGIARLVQKINDMNLARPFRGSIFVRYDRMGQE